MNLTRMKSRLWGKDLQSLQWHAWYKVSKSYHFHNPQLSKLFMEFLSLETFFRKTEKSGVLGITNNQTCLVGERGCCCVLWANPGLKPRMLSFTDKWQFKSPKDREIRRWKETSTGLLDHVDHVLHSSFSVTFVCLFELSLTPLKPKVNFTFYV